MSTSARLRSTHDRRRWGARGFTLVELLAATVLAALLMAALLGVLKAVTRSEKSVLQPALPEAWQSRLAGQLQWDLTNSRTFVTTPNGFELRGFAGRDFESGAALHCPSSIQYVVRTIGSKPSLVRLEAHLDSQSLDNQSMNLVCNRIERITLGALDGTATPSNPSGAAAPEAGDGSPIPDRLLVCLYGVGQEAPVFQHAFNLR
jgi:prepilin-type N-terminal cleavage/methylation domain-containing protein